MEREIDIDRDRGRERMIYRERQTYKEEKAITNAWNTLQGDVSYLYHFWDIIQLHNKNLIQKLHKSKSTYPSELNVFSSIGSSEHQ